MTAVSAVSIRHPRLRHLSPAIFVAFLVAAAVGSLRSEDIKEWVSGIVWPEVKVVDPGLVGGPPSDAIVLFDGKNMDAWTGGEQWILKDGCGVANKADIQTKQAFGDCQLHVEWAAPEKVEGDGQERGNSGVFLMGLYEIQILDCYRNSTYRDGMTAAIYKQHPPLVNACRRPGQWQTYDILFEAPRFDAKGRLARPAYMTVFHNGVVVQNHFQLEGATAWHKPPAYEAHPAKLPLRLQYHLDPVRFRNIWIRELPREEWHKTTQK